MEQAVEGPLGVTHLLGKVVNGTPVGQDAQPPQLLMGDPVRILNRGKLRRQSLSDPGGMRVSPAKAAARTLTMSSGAASQATAATAPLRRASA